MSTSTRFVLVVAAVVVIPLNALEVDVVATNAALVVISDHCSDCGEAANIDRGRPGARHRNIADSSHMFTED
jgi:hypothetical protein